MTNITLNNGTVYTFNEIVDGDSSKRCVTFNYFSETEQKDISIDISVSENTDNGSIELYCILTKTLNHNLEITYDLVFLNSTNTDLIGQVGSFIIPSNTSSYLKEVFINTSSITTSNYVGISILGISDDEFSENKIYIDEDNIYKIQVPASINVTGWDILDNERIRFEITFENIINDYINSGSDFIKTSLDSNFDEDYIDIWIKVDNDYNGKTHTHQLRLNRSKLIPGDYTEIEIEFENDFFEDTASSDLSIEVVRYDPEETNRFIMQ